MSNLQPSVKPSPFRGFAEANPVLRHPDDVLADPALTADEKREILAGWASDDHAVRDAPSLRQLDSGAVVHIDEILGALRTLDRADAERKPVSARSSRRRRPMRARLQVLVRRRDDDDDPPPSPAAAFPLEVAMARRRRWERCGGREPAVA